MKTETITTHDIRKGDLILNHGMRLRVDQDPHETSHPVNQYSPTLAVAAVIENFDEIEDDFIRGIALGDMSPHGNRAANGLPPYTEPRWTIQGNGLARWSREVKG